MAASRQSAAPCAAQHSPARASWGASRSCPLRYESIPAYVVAVLRRRRMSSSEASVAPVVTASEPNVLRLREVRSEAVTLEQWAASVAIGSREAAMLDVS